MRGSVAPADNGDGRAVGDRTLDLVADAGPGSLVHRCAVPGVGDALVEAERAVVIEGSSDVDVRAAVEGVPAVGRGAGPDDPLAGAAPVPGDAGDARRCVDADGEVHMAA